MKLQHDQRTGRVPQQKVDRLAVHHDVGLVIVKHSWYVFFGEGVLRVRDEQAGFPDRAVADSDALDGLHGREECGGEACKDNGLRHQGLQSDQAKSEIGEGIQCHHHWPCWHSSERSPSASDEEQPAAVLIRQFWPARSRP